MNNLLVSSDNNESKNSEIEDIIMHRKSHKGKKIKSYTIKDKLKMIELAKLKGNRFTARLHGVDEKSIREWRKQEDKLREQPLHRSKLPGGGRNKKSSVELEKKTTQIVNHLKEQVIEELVVSIDFDLCSSHSENFIQN
ncbi:hypothetical protein BLOT_016110 [Blomia tropicalis]|nr:hypothetical protein BLOT_016110 [Blomia tropicalis]